MPVLKNMETLTAAEYRALVAKKRQPTNRHKGSKAKAEIEMITEAKKELAFEADGVIVK